MNAGAETRHAAMNVALLECPTCRAGAFRPEADLASDLLCDGCGRSYRVRQGILCAQGEFDDYSENYDKICTDDIA